MMKERVIAKNNAEAEELKRMLTELFGIEADEKFAVWTGIVPPNSFMDIAQGVRMSSPEFYLFRKMAESNDVDARTFACEMLGHVVTSLSNWRVPAGKYVWEKEPATEVQYMMAYLSQVDGDESVERVKRLIRSIAGTTAVMDYERFVAGCYDRIDASEVE